MPLDEQSVRQTLDECHKQLAYLEVEEQILLKMEKGLEWLLQQHEGRDIRQKRGSILQTIRHLWRREEANGAKTNL
ncbi:MAG: hypothetical protein Q7O66_16600 [Dehalococcoidia bacterium]|nr:hypothetical protein [Dehalococcoidia bacterium]